jgi:GntR family transcriptional regulator
MFGLAQPPSKGSDVSAPAYQVVIDHITDGIRTGRYAPGAKLPTIVQLAEITGASQTAVKTALLILRERGIVRGQQGKGTFVADR